MASRLNDLEREKQKARAIKLRDEGLSQAKIANRLGCAQSTVGKWLQAVSQGATNGAILTDTANRVILSGINPKAQVEKLNARLNDMWDNATKPEEIITLNGEILDQLKFYLKLMESLYNVQRVEVFMKAVVEAMEETSPDIVREFKRRLNAKSAMAGQRFDI